MLERVDVFKFTFGYAFPVGHHVLELARLDVLKELLLVSVQTSELNTTRNTYKQ